MQQVPLSPIAAQSLSIVLDNQPCVISVYQRRTGLYIDVFVVNGPVAQPVCTCVLCQNLSPLVLQQAYGFIGTLTFFDTQGDTAPTYQGLGSVSAPGRYQLLFVAASEMAAAA
jgi:hypothetical protein